MATYFWQGFLLGGAAAIQPGAFMAYLLAQTVQHGWRKTMPMSFAPIFSDTPIILFVLLILTQMPLWFLDGLRLVGGCFLLYLARHAWLSQMKTIESPVERQSVFKAAFINLLNPGPYLFWSIIGGPILLTAWRLFPLNTFSFMGGFYLALVGGAAAVIVLFGLTQRLDPRSGRWLGHLSATILGLFGIYQLWLGITHLFFS